MKKGFDYKKYIVEQKIEILKRLNLYDRLYLEFGGKLCYDMHASRVLPGYLPSTKVKLLKELGDLEIMYCVNAKDLGSSRILGDFELNYKKQVLKDLKDIKKFGLKVNYIVITRYEGEVAAKDFKKVLEGRKFRVVVHKEIPGYPESISKVFSGFDKEQRVPVKSRLIVITGPSGGSAKMSTALNQIYLDRKLKVKAGFSKFETFPIWNLPLAHPINVAYEAATADLDDHNVIDPYHKKAYGVRAVNYNRDVENFGILKKMASRLFNGSKFRFKSPTDIGVNMAKRGIIDDAICRKAAIKEIKRRNKIYNKEFKRGRESEKTVSRMNEIVKKVV